MAGFEQGFADAERAAIAVTQAAAVIARTAKQMQKAAADGDIVKIRKASDGLHSALEAAMQGVANAKAAWPYSPEAEEAYLRDGYEEEFLEAARSSGLKINRQDERLVAFPSVVRIMAVERAVRVDKSKVPMIRPTKLVGLLKANQTKKPKFASEKFLDAMFRAYRLIVRKDGAGRTIPLAKVYEAITLLPGTSSEYAKSDFGRDLFFLNGSGLTKTKSGADFSLPASTATREGAGVFSFVGEDGEVVKFWGIRFSEVD